MFNENMTYWDMDRLLKDISQKRNLGVLELAENGDLKEEDIELFLAAYLKEFKLEEKDLNNSKKVAMDIFYLSSKLQNLKTKKF